VKRRHRVGRSLLKRKRTTAQLTQDFRAALAALEQRVGRQHVLRIQTEDDPRYLDTPRRHQLREQTEE
jgi:hypothetical protein